MGKYTDLAVQSVTNELARHGNRIINECINEITYQHDTYNLHDSYGFGVYHKGSLVKHGTLERNASKSKMWYGEEIKGSEEIIKFLNSYKASNGFELVVAAAMPYAEVLENASSRQKKKYKVISMAFDKLEEISRSNPILQSKVFAITGAKKVGT